MTAPSFQLYAADFLIDTQDWTVDEIGIYFRLLLHEWVNGHLPSDQKRLSRIAGCSSKKFQKGWRIIEIKFTQNGDGFLYNNRLERTRKEQEEYRKHQSESGLRGVDTKRQKGIYPFNKSSDPSSDPSSENQALQSSSSLSSINTTCPQQQIVDLYHEVLPELRKVKIWSEARQKMMRQRWKHSDKTSSLEWWRDFFGYIKRSDFLMGNVKEDFQVDLEWIIRPKNFVKIVEGKYHR